MPTPPFLRWAGGKGRLLPVLRAALPADLFAPNASCRYIEPFVGGAAVFFELALPGHRCVLADVNGDLVTTYRALRDRPDQLIAALRELAVGFDEQAFYQLRASAPDGDVERAARLIAYNRTCFNGLFRTNSAGQWNTPYGHLKRPTICNESRLRACSAALAGTEIRSGAFGVTTTDVSAGDVVYVDPPYLPASPTSSFTRYAQGGFSTDDHRELARTVLAWRDRGARVLMSNSDTPLAREIFGGLDLHTVSVRRSISADGSARGTVPELLALSYPVECAVDPAAFDRLAPPRGLSGAS